jgi:catechol 2,3-dioxygenase-like lactoylglutathione lyase family enzyme
MQHYATIDINPVEPVRIGFRQARGASFRCRFTFKIPPVIGGNLAGGPVLQAPAPRAAIDENPQIVFRPRSQSGAFGYDLTITDAQAGVADVAIDGAFFRDPNGYWVELYTRDSEGHPLRMVAQGEMALTGGAYAYEGPLGPMTLPTPPAGPPGPPGAPGAASTVPGPQGEPGQRGTMWFTGEGPPAGGENFIEGDMYLDVSNGDTWRFDSSTGTWTHT